VSVDVLTETVIRAPRDRVAAYAAEPGNAPEWYVNIDSVRWQTPRPARVGTRVTSPFMRMAIRRATRNDLAKLKAILETADD
jgi:hypothetical protein